MWIKCEDVNFKSIILHPQCEESWFTLMLNIKVSVFKSRAREAEMRRKKKKALMSSSLHHETLITELHYTLTANQSKQSIHGNSSVQSFHWNKLCLFAIKTTFILECDSVYDGGLRLWWWKTSRNEERQNIECHRCEESTVL